MGGQASKPVVEEEKEEKAVATEGGEDSMEERCSEQQFENHSKINFVPYDGSPPNGGSALGEVEVGEEAVAQRVEETEEEDPKKDEGKLDEMNVDNDNLDEASINIEEQSGADDSVANVEVAENDQDSPHIAMMLEPTEGTSDCSEKSTEASLAGKKETEVKDEIEGMIEKESEQNEGNKVQESEDEINTHEKGEKDKEDLVTKLCVTDEQPQEEEAVATEVSKDEAAGEEEQGNNDNGEASVDTTDEAKDDTADGAKEQEEEMREGSENVNEIVEGEVSEDKKNANLPESGIEIRTDEEEAKQEGKVELSEENVEKISLAEGDTILDGSEVKEEAEDENGVEQRTQDAEEEVADEEEESEKVKDKADIPSTEEENDIEQSKQEDAEECEEVGSEKGEALILCNGEIDNASAKEQSRQDTAEKEEAVSKKGEIILGEEKVEDEAGDAEEVNCAEASSQDAKEGGTQDTKEGSKEAKGEAAGYQDPGELPLSLYQVWQTLLLV